MDFFNLHEVETMARERLPASVYDYYAGGAGDEITLAANRRAFDRLSLLPRMLVDVSQRDLKVSLLGTELSAPIVVAPMAFQRLAHPDGELGTARAATGLGLLMTASTFATCSLEEIAQSAVGPLWFQLYVHQDRGITRDLVQRAEAAGYQALVLTVDVAEIGRRERDERNRFRLSPDLRVANFIPKTSDPLLADATLHARGSDQRTTDWSWRGPHSCRRCIREAAPNADIACRLGAWRSPHAKPRPRRPVEPTSHCADR